jgi:hypothetical protein
VWWVTSWIAGRLRPVVEVEVVEVRVEQQGGGRRSGMGVRFDEERVVMWEGWRVGMGIVALLYACACEVVVAEFERSSELPFFQKPYL